MTASEVLSHRRVAPSMHSDSGRSGVGCEGNSIARRPERLRMGNTISIATWNCGGLTFTQRKLCKDLKYDILALTETQDTGSLKGSRNFIPAEPAPSTDKFSGVALLLSDRVAKHVRFSGSCGSRIVYAQIQAEPCNLFIISVYMPHSNRKCKPLPADILKQLEDIISQVSTSHCIILLGDLNCKLKRNDSGVTGRWCIHKTHNAEGRSLLTSCGETEWSQSQHSSNHVAENQMQRTWQKIQHTSHLKLTIYWYLHAGQRP